MSIKKFGKNFICRILESQVRRLRVKNDFKIVAVAGSVGKTSTKLAIAKTLSHSLKTQYQNGNYNDRLTVPLVVFGQKEPAIFNVLAWLKIILSNQRSLKQPYPYEVVVLELGTDAPGQIKDFAYLQPDILVIAAIAPEHMEFFGTIEAVAQEELSAMPFSKQTLINLDDIAPQFLPTAVCESYGITAAAQYKLIKREPSGLVGQKLTMQLADGATVTAEVNVLGEQGAKLVLASLAVAAMLDVQTEDLAASLQQITPVAGRMQLLPGKKGSSLIDDTYNASPLAVRVALDVLYAAETPQRIAILGSMNEMGVVSPQLHQEVGEYCDPDKLGMVLTIGEAANKYLAPAAQKRGCTVVSFTHPTSAGKYALDHLGDGAVVLAKGSQNGVFAEEALVPLLENPADAVKLVRQSVYWQAKKQRSLPPLT